MFRALLIRHAEHALQDQVLIGRSPGISLTTRGRERARCLARSLRCEGIALVQTSPRERCRETADEICHTLGLPCVIEEALDEIDFGAWTGARFSALDDDPQWRSWNELRSLACPPGGESMRAAQQRIVRHVEETGRRVCNPVVMVTHAEMIRAALLHERNLPLDAWNSLVVPPGSATELGCNTSCDFPGVRGAAA